MGKHEPKIGRMIPNKDKSGYTVLGKITMRLIEKATGWGNGSGSGRHDK